VKRRRGLPLHLLALLLTLPAALLPPATAQADERILEYRSDIQLSVDGEVAVTETIRVRAEGQQIRRGIYRDFPTDYRDRWGNRVRAGFTPLSVQRDGANEPWHSERRANGVRVYFGSADRMLQPGVHEYRFSFTTNRQLGYFDDFDELYFNAIGTGWAFPIDRAEATLELPFSLAADQLRVSAYSGPFGARESQVTVDYPDANRVRFETRLPLAPGEGLTIAVGWPKGLVHEPTADQRVRWFLGDNAAALVLLIGFVAALVWYAWAWDKVGRDPQHGVIIPRFEPPAGLSPAACRYVNSMAFHSDAFTAALVSLAVKGMLLIDEDEGDFTLERRPGPSQQPLSRGEQALLDALLSRPGQRIAMENENHQAFRAARQALQTELKKEYLGKLFNRNGIYLLPPLLFSAGAAAVALLFHGGPPVWIAYAVATLLLHFIFLLLLRAPTLSGARVMDEIEGFRRYLGTAEQDRLDRMRSPTLTPEVFEAFLPYAYALGVENNWCQRFAREMPRELRDKEGYDPGWYRGRFHGLSALHHIGDDFSHSFSSAIASASSPPGSSSGSGGGGSSGGGGGGGGGGGW